MDKLFLSLPIFEATVRTAAIGSGTAKAVVPALKRWTALQRYASSGILPIDNTPVENEIRPMPSASRTGCLPAPGAAAAAPTLSSPCSPPPRSTASIQCSGWQIRWKHCPPARTARSTRCCRLRTIRHAELSRKVGRLDAYTYVKSDTSDHALFVGGLPLDSVIRRPGSSQKFLNGRLGSLSFTPLFSCLSLYSERIVLSHGIALGADGFKEEKCLV